ncbi:RNA polymerase gamma-subunit [Crocosphaera watsonii WH 8501]|uniref:RNA polymerase gamma-subunit n=1 Tax=Crocosphaera watsonii WH 8501 TaxID=165597 RepID=Q4BVN9_CROWT|nr:RNA polymerase gamma-subunit [Crocosphaera watsonii WH 8501]
MVKHYRERRVREIDGEAVSMFIKTTPGRIIYNKTIQEALTIA